MTSPARMIDAIVRPTVNTDPHPRAAIAITINTIPQAAVSHRDKRNSRGSSTREGASGW